MAEQRNQFKSVLDFKPQFENVIDALVPDIEFSYSAIMNNTTIQTYFNMLSMEYYGYEYFQLLRTNDLKFKLSARTLNLTILEVVYNILLEIVKRKWRYSEYIAYDMYILPLRIKKYISAVNYKFVATENHEKKQLLKLVSTGARVIIEEIDDIYHDDRISNIILAYRACAANEIESKLNIFKNLSVFLMEAKPVVYQNYGYDFGDKYFKEVEELIEMKSDNLSEKQKNTVKKVIDRLFDVGMVVILLMGDAIKAGIWEKHKKAEKRRVEANAAKKAIEEANRRLEAIKTQEEKEQKLLTTKQVKK